MATNEKIGVVGAGVMGRGIAQLFAQSGFSVTLFDAEPGVAANARAAVLELLSRQVEKGKLTAANLVGIAARLGTCASLDEFSGCDIVIEAVVEDLSVKQAIFGQIERVVDASAIIASNTSSLTISALAAVCTTPERVAGLHFFNPVPLMKIVEVIPGIWTDPAVSARLAELVARTGHRSVLAADQPGFLINHAGRALYTEGLRIIEENAADAATVDLVMRESCGFRMGPFELLDLTGLDVSGKVMQSIFDQFQHDPRYRPSSLIPPRIAAGLYGRKSGRGFYDYAQGAPTRPAEPPVPPATNGKVWIEPGDAASDIAALLRRGGAQSVDSPAEADVQLVLPLGEDATAAAIRHGLDAGRVVALDRLIPSDKRQVIMAPPGADPTATARVAGWIAAAGVSVSIIGDSTGFIAQRILSMIVNTGCEIAQRKIASPMDIDTAVTIGLGYPKGPLELGDAIGPARVLQILSAIQTLSGDPRYRPSPWLRRRASLGRNLMD